MQKNIKINTVGFIGLGVMGMSMFKNLTKCKELSPQGFDIDNDKLSTLKKMNLKQASNIEEIYKKNDLLLPVCLAENTLRTYTMRTMQCLL